MTDICFRNNIDERKIKIIWAEGEVVDTLLKLSKLNIVDLLILGAVEKENILNDLLKTLQERYHLKKFPYYIECIDISHLSGGWMSG